MTKYLTLALLLLTGVPTYATQVFTNSSLNGNPTPEGADIALYVLDAGSGKELYAERAEQFQQPASLQKIITGLAARLVLDTDFRFETTVETTDRDVIINFSGDPTFTRTHLRALIEKLKLKQTSIQGNLYLNGGAFDTSERAVGVTWDVMGVCYSAPSSSITMNGNCVYGKIEGTTPPPVKSLKASGSPYIDITAGDIIIREGLENQNIDCDLKLMTDNSNHYSLDGCVGSHRLPVNFHLAVQNTTLYLSKVLQEELDRAGIRLNGKIIRNDKISGTVIALHQSEPVMKLIDIMMKRSDNLIADNLLKTVGRVYYKQPGSYENGAAAVKAVLKEKANIDLSRAVIMDGSGLSRNNRITAKDLMQVVQYIFSHKELGLIETLPVSGQSGTLQYRSSLVNAPLTGQVTAKTGSIYGVYNLAGKIKTKSGKSLYFVQLLSNYHPESDNRNIARKPLRDFERGFYEKLYNEN
ncbi:D-alanyl-D-alanine carboxypeptidase/D-alanyl-D-alanine endopeptidase [Methylophaga pinxianii]|uniref:D-alanyl-D-alanine carboxypeptidase/D-alanyl-D-alanine endopeptidase n=1 Tax=Methylophaga pinxianii TaxID=2881052 RepID=UPI001CF33FBF|nr:D-alanyl-D-alanine carboxypeptidase/D-alanyl-D-alanine-endopeptidase [Methylophaga pinxianii]MCB2427456.1 D-alanyl-D-alanine carboxypeptidase/D-alanyl-D-alanine-endopeptidase [Methylophaga pinxianii]UPH44737.1 D-alanyl-D-alanine carboxypeptidase/D-alanyl-D-alanine-endopeptidase [Methylophaga pinxianii]